MPPAHHTISYRPIPGLPGYRAGSDGSIWSCWSRRGQKRNRRTGGIPAGMTCIWRQLTLTPAARGDGYLNVGIRRRTKSVGPLVLLAFVGAAPRGMQCCHWDGNPSNNRIDNLRWDTPTNNHADKLRHGTDNRGHKNPKAKLHAGQVRRIRRLYAAARRSGRRKVPDGRLAAIANRYGVKPLAIGRIIRRQSWGWLK